MRKYQDLSGKKIGFWQVGESLKKRMERFLTIAPKIEESASLKAEIIIETDNNLKHLENSKE